LDLKLSQTKPDIQIEDVIETLKQRKKHIDSIVVTGGEPTIQIGLESFLSKLKNLDFNIKLDTNGSHPEVVRRLVENKLVDYVAIDIKGLFEDYSTICNVEVDTGKITETISIMKNSNVDYEVRTVLWEEHPSLAQIEKIFHIVGYSKYFLQNFHKTDNGAKYTPIKDMNIILEILRKQQMNVKVR
jgi:pyruvate formate lyase activating enzyme